MYITFVNEILALTSMHSGFYKGFCLKLSLKPIRNHTAATVFTEGKRNHHPPGSPMSQVYKGEKKLRVH